MSSLKKVKIIRLELPPRDQDQDQDAGKRRWGWRASNAKPAKPREAVLDLQTPTNLGNDKIEDALGKAGMMLHVDALAPDGVVSAEDDKHGFHYYVLQPEQQYAHDTAGANTMMHIKGRYSLETAVMLMSTVRVLASPYRGDKDKLPKWLRRIVGSKTWVD